MLSKRMEEIKATIKNVIRAVYPPSYLEYTVSGKITLDDIALQVLMESCKYAFDYTSEKHSLRYFIGTNGLDTDIDRMMLQRTLQKINRFRKAEYELSERQTGLEIEGLLPRRMENIDEKLSGYELNEFQFWEINDVHDLKLVDDIICGRIFKKNCSKDTFKAVAEEYDETVSSMLPNVGGSDKIALFSSLAIFTWEWKYAFDFYYKIATEMETSKVKLIPDLAKRCSLFCGKVRVTSQLAFSHPHLAGGTILTDSRMMLLRDMFVPEFVNASKEEFEEVTAQYIEAIVLVSNMLKYMTYEDINIREWFKKNSTLEDWTDVMKEYNVAQCFVENKKWTNKRIRYVKEIYESIYTPV